MRSLHFIRTIGAGAFGTVYLAELQSGGGFRRQVAVKVIQKNQPDSEMFLSRIRDEARLLGLLQDDAILKVLDMVQIEGLDAVVMEYVEGVDLASIVEAGHAPPPRALAGIGATVAGALSRAHRAVHPNSGVALGVIHRDVKPANIMITRTGHVKLLDFGIARAKFDSRESYTGQLVLGTLNYMAPEYIVTGEVSTAADVYGLALSIWEVAVGEVYGQPKVRQDTHTKRVAENLERLKGSHPQLHPILNRMLAWEPSERPDAAAVEQALLVASDELTGKGLRTWAAAVVPQVLGARPACPDTAGFLGRTVGIAASLELAGGGDVQPNDGLDYATGDDPAIQAMPSVPPGLEWSAPALKAQHHTGARLKPEGDTNVTDAPVPPPRPAPSPSPVPRRKRRRKSKQPSMMGLVIKAAIVGGLVGFLVVLLLAVLLVVLTQVL